MRYSDQLERWGLNLLSSRSRMRRQIMLNIFHNLNLSTMKKTKQGSLSGCYNKSTIEWILVCHNFYKEVLYLRLGGLNNRKLLLTVLEAGESRVRCQKTECGVRAHFIINRHSTSLPSAHSMYGRGEGTLLKGQLALSWEQCPYHHTS